MTIPDYLRARLEGGGEEGEAQTGRQCRRRRGGGAPPRRRPQQGKSRCRHPRATGFFLEFPTISVLNASLFIR